MIYRVLFAPEAEDQLAELYHYIAVTNSPDVADRYVEAILLHCEGLEHMPHRGRPRDDIRSGLRTTHYKGHAVIAYMIEEALERVVVLGVYYGGQDYEAALG